MQLGSVRVCRREKRQLARPPGHSGGRTAKSRNRATLVDWPLVLATAERLPLSSGPFLHHYRSCVGESQHASQAFRTKFGSGGLFGEVEHSSPDGDPFAPLAGEDPQVAARGAVAFPEFS